MPHLWDLGTDYYLHFPSTLSFNAEYCAWFCDFDDPEETPAEVGEERYSIGTSESGADGVAAVTPSTTPQVIVEVPFHSFNGRSFS